MTKHVEPHPVTLALQVEFAILGLLPGWVGLRGQLTPVGDNKDTVKVDSGYQCCLGLP